MLGAGVGGSYSVGDLVQQPSPLPAEAQDARLQGQKIARQKSTPRKSLVFT